MNWLQKILKEKNISVDKLKKTTGLDWKKVIDNDITIGDLTIDYGYHLIHTLNLDLRKLYLKYKKE
ncbi:hypothetical protein KHQ81_14960 [Mycoplasmatota bacterium]|nr:hypothetical protein KHQ81_14960 [Mycoplasmatota bacterium]